MQQKTKGLVTSKISMCKTRAASAQEVLENFRNKSGIKIIDATITTDGVDVLAVYGPVWGGQEYDIRQKWAAAMRKVKCAGQVTFDSKRLVVESR